MKIKIIINKIQGYASAFFTIMLLTKLYVRMCILLTGGRHFNDHAMLLRGEVWALKTRLILRLFIYTPLSSQGN